MSAAIKAAPVEGFRYSGTVGHRIAASLKRHGVTHVFAQSLPSMVLLPCAELGIQQVAYRAENTGGYMADGFARASQKVGVVTSQNGPAAALLVAAFGEALAASIPMVALLQEVNRDQADRNAFQESDQIATFSPCSKWVRRVTEASRIEDYIDMAFTIAATGRPGPAVLLLPADLLTEPAKPSLLPRNSQLGFYPLDRTAPDPERLREAAKAVAASSAPVIIAGGGVHLSDASAELAALQESCGIPVGTTVMGKGAVDEGHPLSLGVVGYFMGEGGASRHQRALIEGADLVILVGNRTNQNGTDSWQLYPKNARYLHIDVDGAEIGRNYDALRLVGDARLALRALREALGVEDLDRHRARRPELERRIAAAKDAYRKDVAGIIDSDRSPIRPERVLAEMDAVLTPDSIFVADASYSSIWAANCLHSRRAGQRFLAPRGLAGIGWGLPMALGAKAARPDAPVLCLVGDGGFAHAWSELETSVRMRLPVTLVVLNNQVLGYQMHSERVRFGVHTPANELGPVDHAMIARACGCEAVRVEKAADLGPALRRAAQSKVTTLIDVITDPEARPPLTVFEGQFPPIPRG